MKFCNIACKHTLNLINLMYTLIMLKDFQFKLIKDTNTSAKVSMKFLFCTIKASNLYDHLLNEKLLLHIFSLYLSVFLILICSLWMNFPAQFHWMIKLWLTYEIIQMYFNKQSNLIGRFFFLLFSSFNWWLNKTVTINVMYQKLWLIFGAETRDGKMKKFETFVGFSAQSFFGKLSDLFLFHQNIIAILESSWNINNVSFVLNV